MTRSTRLPRTALLAVLTAIGLVAAACGSDDDASPGGTEPPTTDGPDGPVGDGDLVVYSGRGEDLIGPILERFEEETGIEVSVRYDDSANLALLLEEEASAGRIEADVFLSQSPGSIGFLDGNGRLAQLPAEILDLVPAEVRDDDGRWVGLSGRQRVIVYNTDLVDPTELPDSIFDVIDDRWQGQIGVAGGNGSFQDFVTAMRATEGEEATVEWLEGLADLDPVNYSGNSAIVAAVGRGEVEIGLVNHYYNFRALAEDPDVPSANHLLADGDPGAVLIVTGAAILDGADDPGPAAELIEFLLSSEGQQYFAEETFEYPLAAGEEPAGDVPPIDFTDVGSIDFEELEGGLERTRELIADAGLES